MTLELLQMSEQAELNELETVIERGLQTFYDVGMALQVIREKRLYRESHGTFEAYCQERWNMSKRHANRLIMSSDVIENLGPTGPVLPTSERQARPLTSLEPEQQVAVWERAVETAPNGKVTGAHVQRVVDDMLEQTPRSMDVHYSSNTPEWYTPDHILGRVCEVFGEIDLDPCSNSHTDPHVSADHYFTEADDGLSCRWFGNVYMNPPYGDVISDWVDKAATSYETGDINAAILLVPARTDTQWFRRLRSFPRCFVWGRLKFSGSTNSAPFPSMVVYLGEDIQSFTRAFDDIGDIYVNLQL